MTASSELENATLSIEGKLAIPNGANASNIKVSLNGEKYITLSSLDGSFSFPFIPSGIYLLDVLSVKDIFPQMKIKVDALEKSINVVEYKYPGAKRLQSSYPLIITALSPVAYFQRKAPFSITALIFGNPMMAIMVLSLGAMMFFPKLLQGMDPEQMKELQQEMNAQGGAGDPFAQLKKMAGLGGGEESKEIEDDE